MSEAVIIGLLAFAAIFVWAAYEVLTAPYGEEDEDGYGPINPRNREDD